MDLAALRELLPDSVADMVTRIGMPATQVVVHHLGGTRWRVAEGLTPEGDAKRAALAELVGSDVEELLHREYAGEEIYVPRCYKALLAWRDAGINHRFEKAIRSGQSANAAVAELARAERLSDRRVWDILKTLPPTVQGRLFH